MKDLIKGGYEDPVRLSSFLSLNPYSYTKIPHSPGLKIAQSPSDKITTIISTLHPAFQNPDKLHHAITIQEPHLA